MRILGVDPGLCITGYGLIEAGPGGLKLIEAGVVRTSAKDDIEVRLDRIYEGLAGLMKEYKPEVLVLEQLYSHYKHPMTAILMGHARGAVCLAARRSGAKLVGYAATRIKKAITGAGHASKYQMQRMIQDLFNMSKAPDPPDISDALALAVAHAYMTQKEPVARLTLKVNRGNR
ncbi:MAG: crossover junction endodeoxyribonuclease RuvC [Candidatus Omnitrophota bacterium]|jgi:crossover junction endodeoxyribonuclease RuvC